MENYLEVEEIKGIIKNLDPDKIILFGSRLNNYENLDSDYDLLVIKDTNTKRLYRRAEALKGIKRKNPVDLIILTPDEIDNLLKNDSQFIKEILGEGKVIYEKEKSLA